MVPPYMCPGSPSILDLLNECVRGLWFVALSGAFVLICLFTALPIPYPTWMKYLKVPFTTFLTVDDAEKIIAQSDSVDPDVKPTSNTTSPSPPPSPTSAWQATAIFTISFAHALFYLGFGSLNIYEAITSHRRLIVHDAFQFVWVAIWLYCALRVLYRYPTPTPPYDLFFLFLIQWIRVTFTVSVTVYNKFAFGVPIPSLLTFLATLAQCAVVALLVVLVLVMPLGVPSTRVREFRNTGRYVTDEDYTTLWGWISFNWVDDLITRGTEAELDEKDVPDLSPCMQAKPVLERFAEFKRSSLLRQLFVTNSLDLFLDFSLTFVSVLCNYASPLFLKLILDDIEHHAPGHRSRAYIYAILMFLSSVFKAEADVQHLWFGRRATTRVRSELMASIYAKALRRKDFSGIVKKDAVDESGGDKAKAAKKIEKDDGKGASKAGADTGKIVQLMAADANRIGNLISSAYFLYSAPMEIVIASFMLYRLLGWSAFAGFSVLIVASPLNHLLSKNGVTISRGLSAARDKRMAVLNELIGGIKFIKFFAWEPQWMKRTQEARQYELKWLIKDRINSVMWSTLWSLAPSFVSIVSFWAYIYFGHELTISTAFTAIALFNMLKMPLNVIPMFVVMLLQAGVALDRIATFLEEDEVPDYVSSFKRPVLTASPAPEDQLIGINGASFMWNEVKEPPPKADTKGKKKAPATTSEVPQITVSGPDLEEEQAAAQDEPFELRDIDVMFPVGKLTLVVGPTASGKSALLMALLGEMTLTHPTSPDSPSPIHLPKNHRQLDPVTQLNNSISYCAQTPWLEHATIKQNILFYEPLEEERYDAVISACALQPDLDILEDGDETEIGARGVSLSGGQKARVALARAVYARTKHVLLDDPLAAVDSHTARHLYDNVLTGPLMKDRTCILVTHHVDLVQPGAHYLVRMLDGRIDTQGTIKDLEDQGVLDMIVEDASANKKPDEGIRTPSDDAETMAEATIEGKDVADVDGAHLRSETETTVVADRKSKKEKRKLVKDEERAKGSVKWSIYKTYLKAAGWFTWIWLCFGICIFQSVGVIEKLWIKAWGEHYGQPKSSFITVSTFYPAYGVDQAHSSHDIMASTSWSGFTGSNYTSSSIIPELPSATEHPMFYVAVYAGIGLLATIISVTNSVVQYFGSYKASKILFTRLVDVVIGSPMRFFDTTPTGRILNRFSKDVETVDSSLSSSLRSTSSWVATFIASLLTVIVVLPQFFLPACFIAYGYYRTSYGYVVAGRSLRRMESTTRSPIFAAFGDTLEGLVTVRAFSKEKRFVDNTYAKIDLTTKMWYGFWMLNRWLLLRFDFFGALATLGTTVFALARLDAGLAGLTITASMAFTMSVYWTCRMVTQLEMDLNSVERVVEYLDLPQEAPAVIESNRVPAYWPSSTSNDLVVVEDLVIRYAPELPPVLHGVSFALKPKERVGLLGRTGSGKSTLAMALLRFVDPSSGKIIVDGIDISTIGLRDLRSRLTIIPQDAVLFSGTIRDNLDPFGDHTDAECLDVLARVHINASTPSSRRPSRPASIHESEGDNASVTTSQTGTTQYDDQKHTIGLASKVSAGGANFSQGQRQLIALSRALLRRSTIIIMDEATSSIDFRTDSLVQKTIREEFSESLLITIAHRIRTIIDYDRLVVLDQGNVVEFDTPLNLIQREGGVFRGMCLKSGNFEELLAACQAKESS